MRFKHLTGSALALLALIPASALAGGLMCKHSADRSGGVDAAGAEKVVIRAAAGDLKVVGGARNVRVEARGRACASSEALLDKTQINVRREGNTIYVETGLPQDDTTSWSLIGNSYAYIDAGIALPADIPVEAIDSSGDATFEDLHALTLQDSSGDLTVRRVAGLADIGDSSGDIEVREVGSVKLNDSSGDIELDDVRSDVDIDNDSSGDIRITQVGGHVRVRNDSSGGIKVEDVKGSFVVDNDSSGDIVAVRIAGDFTVNGDSTGSVSHESIGGKITVPNDD